MLNKCDQAHQIKCQVSVDWLMVTVLVFYSMMIKSFSYVIMTCDSGASVHLSIPWVSRYQHLEPFWY